MINVEIFVIVETIIAVMFDLKNVSIPYVRMFKFVRVCSLVGRYFINVYIVKSLKLCFPLFQGQ